MSEPNHGFPDRVAPAQAPEEGRGHRLRELAILFSRLGLTSFGGPAAHLGVMEEQFVRRHRWLNHLEFLDLVSAANLIPGPNSTEVAIHLGRNRAGWPGLFVAGLCFIVPAMLLVMGLAWAYVRYGQLAPVEGVLYGVKPVMIAVVVQALWGLGRAAIRTRLLAVAALVGAALNTFGVDELVILFATGLALVGARVLRHGLNGQAPPMGLWTLAILPGAPAAGGTIAGATAVGFSCGALFLFFLKVGSVLFGSGYVLLAFLRADLVEHWGWLTESQLLDAIAVGQVTPGPVFTTATFIGYLLGGPWGAVVATVGIFLPAFFFVAVSAPLIPKLRASPLTGAFLDGVNVASLALMAVVTGQLGASALVDWPTVLLAFYSAFMLLRYRVNSVWLVLGGGAIGLTRSLIQGSP